MIKIICTENVQDTLAVYTTKIFFFNIPVYTKICSTNNVEEEEPPKDLKQMPTVIGFK